ncbi:hypothetical protein Q5692_23715 [Microcoleus sp. C2C3]|uniref:hypothetical protein n=1 Tax=unclassified Microcoleus TaxID=2642155 RepID=UPI002FD07158
MLKTELHCHLEGSIQPAPLLKVAARNNIELPFSDEKGANKYYQLKTMFHGDVVDNYLQVAKTFNLTAEDIKNLASFRDDLTKANYLGFTSEVSQLRTALFNVYQGYRHG